MLISHISSCYTLSVIVLSEKSHPPFPDFDQLLLLCLISPVSPGHVLTSDSPPGM